jgi:glycosyltransferase involved in cell wall biosynthesis
VSIEHPLKFSIVTPSYKQPQWLRLCAASVADQSAPGLEIEHIVQDSLSGPEIAEAVKTFPQLSLVSEKDKGMYDAINRGWEKATGDVLCWLNCDEQYLPGILKDVADYFRAHPEVEVLFADAIIVDNDGKYICSRPVLTPQLYHTWTCHLQTFSCSTFFRRSLLKERGFALDSRWKDLGDADLIVRMLRAGVRMDIMRRYTTSFVDNGENRSLQPHARKERETLMKEAPHWVQILQPAWILLHRLRRLWNGIYSPRPFVYDIYTLSSPQKRVHFEVAQPTFYWTARMK